MQQKNSGKGATVREGYKHTTGDYVIVQGYAWLPKPKSVFTEEANLAYLVILNSTMFFDLLSAISNNLGGGQLNLSARFVNEVALPDIMSPEIDGQAIRRLVEIGRRIHAGNLNTNESTITELVSSVYHLPLDS